MSPKLLIVLVLLLITAVSTTVAQTCDVNLKIAGDDVLTAYNTVFKNGGMADPTPVDPTLGPKVLISYGSVKFAITNYTYSTINVSVAQAKAAFDSILPACCNAFANLCKAGDWVNYPPGQDDPDLDYGMSFVQQS